MIRSDEPRVPLLQLLPNALVIRATRLELDDRVLHPKNITSVV